MQMHNHDMHPDAQQILASLEANRLHCTGEEYHAHEALACSQLLSAGVWTESEEHWTPHLLAKKIEPTADMDRGTLTHAAYYEPETFHELYAIRPMKNGRAVACDTAEYAAWSAQHPGKIHIHPNDLRDANGMVEALAISGESGCLKKYIEGSDIISTEAAYIIPKWWNDIQARIKPDRLRVRRSDGRLICEDLKSARDISPREFRKTCEYGLQYYRRAAFYRRALRLITGHDCIVRMIAVESSAPHLVALYEIDETKMDEADRQNSSAMAALERCIESGEFQPAWLNGAYRI